MGVSPMLFGKHGPIDTLTAGGMTVPGGRRRGARAVPRFARAGCFPLLSRIPFTQWFTANELSESQA